MIYMFLLVLAVQTFPPLEGLGEVNCIMHYTLCIKLHFVKPTLCRFCRTLVET